jgi:Transposase IS116/IS110/IS902 family
VARLRSTLREYFPAALLAFEDLDAPDALELLGRAPDPDQAARLSLSMITAALKRARRRHVEDWAQELRTVLRAQELRQPPVLQNAYAAVVASEVAIIDALNVQIDRLGEVVAGHFGRHRDAEIYASLPGLGAILGARVLGEFGDAPGHFADAKARKNYAGTSPVTRASGTKKVVLARYARNRRLADALQQWAFCSLRGSPGARAYYQQLRDRKIGHQAALRQLANRLVGILHGCLKPAPPTTSRPLGRTTPQPPLDSEKPGMSAAIRAQLPSQRLAFLAVIDWKSGASHSCASPPRAALPAMSCGRVDVAQCRCPVSNAWCPWQRGAGGRDGSGHAGAVLCA